MKRFIDVFGTDPAATAQAPGRVNLLGEHTDYNDGFVLPTPIPQTTTVRMGPSADGIFRAWSSTYDHIESWEGGDAPMPEGFSRYIFGCVKVLQDDGYKIPPTSFMIMSNIPMGVGLSSSAALEVAVLRALRLWRGLPLNDVQLAKVGQRAERQYVGVACGIMDQLASSLGDHNHLLFIDTRSLERRVVNMPEGSELMVLDSGIVRKLTESRYNQRRGECEEATRLLQVQALRDVSDPNAVSHLPEPICRRARHVVSENLRVLETLKGLNAEALGSLMNASHASLRDDFEVSVPLLDKLVAILQADPDVFGARLTGAGFGGACVSLVRLGKAAEVSERVLDEFRAQGGDGKRIVPMGW